MASPRTPDLLLDRVVAAIGDRYDVEGELGRGGMAVVYRARDVRLRRPVALKVLPPDLAFREGVRARFLREAETAAQLSHPNIVPIYAADETGGLAWLAMALIGGETLGARMAREPRMPVAEARRILTEVADALAYAHARGVVHRDIKPDNILLDADSGRALVTDFGIARAAEADQRLTLTGIAVGTPTYMSPEQALGEGEVDGRSDLYSLGIVGYQMLAGAPPFSATSAAALLLKHVGERPAPIAQLRPDVPPSLALAIDRALAKKPEDRWSDAAAFRHALVADAAPPRMLASGMPAGPGPVPVPQPSPMRGAASGAPTMSLDWREQRDEWKERLKEQRREWRERQREQRQLWRDTVRAQVEGQIHGQIHGQMQGQMQAHLPVAAAGMPWGVPGTPNNPLPSVPLDRRAESFRRRAIGSFAIVLFLCFVNAASHVPFPWAIFPAMGILGGVRRRWRPLGREGLSFLDVMFGGGDAVATAAAPQVGRASTATLVRRLRNRITLTVVAFFLSALSFAIGTSIHADPMIVPFVGFLLVGVWGLQSSLFTGMRIRRAGIPLRSVLSAKWEDAVALADTRPREVILSEEAARLAGADVLGSPYGRVVRGAVDDRLMVRETLTRLPETERALLPKTVLPTIDDLVTKIAGLAQSLHRLDGDVSPLQLEQLDERLRIAEAAPAGTPDRDRKLQLLQRQRTSIVELLERRASLAAQMESAQLVLQNIKLDLIKLRSSGGMGVGDVSTATQEATALSRDIKYALEAAGELRSL